MRSLALVVGLLALPAGPSQAQDRDATVRNDRKTFEASGGWIYDDLDEAVREARNQRKPLLVVFRCIPSESCRKFDDDVARRDPVVRDLLDQFVCVRIVQANRMDLTRFQFDFDLSFAAFLMNPDLTIYGRYGTRSGRSEFQDISLEGLGKAMSAALRIHHDYRRLKPTLAGKQVRPTRYKTPRDYPGISDQYKAGIDYESRTARSCLHCHQVREAERLVYRSAGKPIPDEVLFPYPDPEVLGLSMDPREMAVVAEVEPGSAAGQAGVRKGDAILSLSGQLLLSIADLQWVLQNAPATGRVEAVVVRDGKAVALPIVLDDGWRRGNIAWRASTRDLRRLGLGGLSLAGLSETERREAGLPSGRMALRVQHTGEQGEHSAALRAGARKGDIIVSFDGRDQPWSESELLAYCVQRKKPGESIRVEILRGSERKTLAFALP